MMVKSNASAQHYIAKPFRKRSIDVINMPGEQYNEIATFNSKQEITEYKENCFKEMTKKIFHYAAEYFALQTGKQNENPYTGKCFKDVWHYFPA